MLCQSGQGAIYTWTKENALSVVRRPYKCCSWRHEGPCARREAAVTFARIQEAMNRPGFDAEGWVFAVLTLDREGYYSGAPWRDVQQAFRALSRMTSVFLARVRRLCKRNGWRILKNEWVATVEQHKSGWPHVNIVMYAPELARELAAQRELNLSRGQTPRGAILLEGELRAAAVSAGWGHASTAEQARSKGALAGYIVKIAGKHDEVTGELAKLTQTPTNAEGKFRRLRSGKGFLPPRRKNENITGTMMRRTVDPQRSAYGAMPLHTIKNPELVRMAEKCMHFEEDRMAREAEARRCAEAFRLPYAQLAPPAVEVYRIVGANFEVQGEALTIDGEQGYSVDADGFVKFSPSRTADDFDDPGGQPEQLTLPL